MKRLLLAAPFLLVAALGVFAQERSTPKPAPAAKGADDAAIDFNRARKLLQKRQGGEKLSADEQAYLDRAQQARRRGAEPKSRPKGDRTAAPQGGKDSIGQKPLSEMTADDRYQREDGGLYGKGNNTPPAEHQRVAEAAIATIEPLDAAGKPSKDGKIGLVSISMSNATQEFSLFKQHADKDPLKSPRVAIVDCAQGGQAMAEWVDPNAQPWQEAARRLMRADVSPQQVQAAWIKLANKAPRGSLTEHGAKLKSDTIAVIQNAQARFPNLRIVYLGSRIYGGYSQGALNPEPYAYETAFVARWLIHDQMKGASALNHDASRGPVKAPVLVWGPYFWADGMTPRKADGLVWERTDLSGDGVHPSDAGREKAVAMLLKFFKGDPLAKSWFTDNHK